MRKRLSFQYAIEAIVLLLVATCFILLARVAYHDRNLSKSLYADGGDEALALHSKLCQLDKVIAGNTFNYPCVHGSAVMQAGYSFVSCI